MVLKNTLLDYWREIQKSWLCRDFHPDHPESQALGDFRTLGSLQNNMYTTVIDEEDYAIKPMNCPGGVLGIRF